MRLILDGSTQAMVLKERVERGEAMSLGAIAVTGLVAAVVLIVIAITLINKFAN